MTDTLYNGLDAARCEAHARTCHKAGAALEIMPRRGTLRRVALDALICLATIFVLITFFACVSNWRSYYVPTPNGGGTETQLN